MSALPICWITNRWTVPISHLSSQRLHDRQTDSPVRDPNQWYLYVHEHEWSQVVTVLANVYMTNWTAGPGTRTIDERSQIVTVIANVYMTNQTAGPGTQTIDEWSQIITVIANVYMTNRTARPGTSTNDTSHRHIQYESSRSDDFAKFSRKLHEIERIWAPRGEARPSRPPLNPLLRT